jgi:hypothetical protein
MRGIHVSWVLVLVLCASCGGGSKFSGDGDTDVTGDADDVRLDRLDEDTGGGDVPVDGDEDAPDGAGECSDASDCVTLYGPAPCGAWECNDGVCEVNCPGCTDGDMDGYGTGSCAGPDCDDADDTIFDSHTRSCYSGASGTAGRGVCREGTEICTAGVWAPCVGEVVPSGEACNLEDDDCDGSVDEDLGNLTCGIGACLTTVAACTGGVVGTCVPGTPGSSDPCGGGDEDCDGAIDEDCSSCVPVSPSGNDSTADGSTTNPFGTIQGAIDWAAADSTRPRIVCVASGYSCGGTSTYSGTVTMSNGISVYGQYRTSDWTRCTSSTTIIATTRAEGVIFPSTVTTTTVLDGFQVNRHPSATTAAVTVDGATSVILSNLRISNSPSVTNSYGINMINGAEALIMSSWVDSGIGSAESIAIRSVGSTPTIRDNCQSYDGAGRCDIFCSGTGDAIRGEVWTTTRAGANFAVYLEDSPGAIVERSAMCNFNDVDGAGIRIHGDGSGILIRANSIGAWGGENNSHGVWLDNCAGAAPWIVDNHQIAAEGNSTSTLADGIRAIGDCHPVIDSNVHINGGSESGAASPSGIYCGADPSSGVASQCVVLGNLLIEGSAWGVPVVSVGVRCDDDGCMRIANNVITGRGGIDTYGIHLGECGTFIDNNTITGGCGSTSATGVYSEDSFVRLQNNLIFAGECTGGATTADHIGLHVLVSDTGHEMDVHSNDIDGDGQAGACTSTGLELDVTGTAPAGGVGIFRNNIINAGQCNVSNVVVEAHASSDPRIFESNDLDPRGSPVALYMDETSSGLTTHTAVNALTDMTVSGNISADPLFTLYPTNLHLSSGSPCDGAGTATGAPAFDMDGDARSTTAPDIGADEM